MLEKIEKFQILLLGLLLALGAIISTAIFANMMSKDVISVTGSYSQEVTSDKGKFDFYINSREATRAKSYAVLSKQIPQIEKYLVSKGFKKEDIDVNPISGYEVYDVTPNGSSTNRIVAYNASQMISVKSGDVKKVKKVSTEIYDLAQKGIEVSSSNAEYYYSKLSDLKVEMLEKATQDAKHRASAMLKATRNRVGKIQSLQMGVFQITPAESTNVSDYGISDTSSIQKKITAVANVTFRVK